MVSHNINLCEGGRRVKLYNVYIGGSFKTKIEIEADDSRQAEAKAIDHLIDNTDLELEVEDVDVHLTED